MRRKVLTMLLAVCMTATLLAGCSGKGESQEGNKVSEEKQGTQDTADGKEQETAKEPVTLEWWYRGNGVQKDTEKVEAAFNELLQTYPGMEHVTVNLNCYLPAEYKNAVLLAQSSNQQIDILNTVNLDFATEVENGTFLALNDYLEENDAVRNELPDWLWNLGTVDGSTYIVPNYQRASNNMYFITPKEYMDQYGNLDEMRAVIQDENKTIEELAAMLEGYCAAVQAGEGPTHYMPSIGDSWVRSWGFAPFYDSLDNYFVKFAGERTVQHLYMTEEAKKAYELATEWYEKGYIHPDILTVDTLTLERENMLNDVSLIYAFNNQAGDEETVSEYYSNAYGLDVYAIPIHTNYYIGSSWGAGGNGITAKCEHPEEAFRLIELMTTEEGKELYNMMVYGLEGVHYEKIDDTHIRTLEYDGTQGNDATSYAGLKWIIGNTFHAYLNQGCAENEIEIAKDINENPDNVKSDLVGLNLEKNDIQTQLDQVNAVVEEYYPVLSSGIKGDNWESYYEEFEQKMNASGLQEILENLQGQLDAFYADK